MRRTMRPTDNFGRGGEPGRGRYWDIQCDQRLTNNYGGNVGDGGMYFIMRGQCRRRWGPGTTTFSIQFVNSGTLDVEIGKVSFNGNNSYGQTAALLRFGLGGPANSGQVNIAGNINFDGTLAASLVRGYVPKAGDAISLVTYNSQGSVFNGRSAGTAGRPRLAGCLQSDRVANSSRFQCQQHGPDNRFRHGQFRSARNQRHGFCLHHQCWRQSLS